MGEDAWVAAMEAASPRSAGRGRPPGQYLRDTGIREREISIAWPNHQRQNRTLQIQKDA